MSPLRIRIRNSSKIVCLGAITLLNSLSARAEFFPDKGITVKRWKEPEGGWGFQRSYWIDDHELIYIRPDQNRDEQYVKRNLRTGEEQILTEFTKRVFDNNDNSNTLPVIYPSPDGKYLTWVAREYTQVIAKSNGEVQSRRHREMPILYPGWSHDSTWSFCFLEGEISEISPETKYVYPRAAFIAISAESVNTPSKAKTYPISRKPIGEQSTLTGYYARPQFPGSPVIHEGPGDPGLSNFHWHGSHITLVSPNDDLRTVVFEEFNIADTSRCIATHSIIMPDGWYFGSAVFSPKGDAIAWKILRQDKVEIWISSGTGKNLKRIGKFYAGEAGSLQIGFTEPLEPNFLQWLPNGKTISFREARELYVVSASSRTQ